VSVIRRPRLALLAAAGLLFSGRAGADPPPAGHDGGDLQTPGPAGSAAAIEVTEGGCFDRQELGARVDRYLGHPIASPGAITVRDGPDRLEIKSRAGTVARDVGGWSCAQRLDYTAVSVSILLEGAYQPPPPLVPIAPIAPPAPPPFVPIAPPPLPPPKPRDPAPEIPRIELAAQAGGAFDVLPTPAAALVLGVDRTLLGPLDLRAALVLSSAVDARLRTVDARASLLAGVAEACLARGDALRVRLCAGLASGRVAVSWSTLTPTAWSAAAGRLDGRYRLSRQISLAAGLDVFLPFGTPRVEVVDPNPCPANAASSATAVCNAAAGIYGGKVVAASLLPRTGMMLTAGPVLTFW
jgi:hypothetical protein